MAAPVTASYLPTVPESLALLATSSTGSAWAGRAVKAVAKSVTRHSSEAGTMAT